MFKNRKIPHWIFLYVVAILLVAGAVNGLMYLSVPTLPVLDAKTWLGFWGSYLGGAIGCVPALLALYDNRREARRQHEESEKSRRLAALPVMACEDNSSSFSLSEVDSLSSLTAMVFLDSVVGLHGSFNHPDPNQYREKLKQLDDSYPGVIFFDIHNIGAGPALNVTLACSNILQTKPLLLKNIGTNETRSLLLCVQIPPRSDNNYQIDFNFEITFNDIFGNTYVQKLNLNCTKEQHSLSTISIPNLC